LITAGANIRETKTASGLGEAVVSTFTAKPFPIFRELVRMKNTDDMSDILLQIVLHPK
jgi:hypothetical protein